ncbi:MAG: hypothetical protein OEX02_02220 [Cyclobacteriaceae bacterium]|nr:hypothetical protein [Cyclobacteriaceae bacterium]
MSREKSNALFQLVKSMTKNEKRYFRLYAGKGNGQDKKTLQLFDTLIEQDHFDDNHVLEINTDFKPEQLSNLKAELYKQLLHALRMYSDGKIIDIKIRQLIDFSQILVDRCLYKQAYDQLKKAKKVANQHDNLEMMLEIGKLEINVLTYIIDNQNQRRVNKIVAEISHINERINRVNQLSNLNAKLNSLYKKVGFIRDQRDHHAIENYLTKNLPEYHEEELSLLEKIHLHNLFTGYYFFIHDFKKGYTAAKKLVALFDDHPSLRLSKIDFYIQALNKLSIAQTKLSLYDEFVSTVDKLQNIPHIKGITLNEDIRTKLFKYYYLHEINRYLLLGDFTGGVKLINKIHHGLNDFITRLDQHSSIIFYYKIACLYFGNSQYNHTLVWLNKIINTPNVDIRRDIHCFARILNLVTHFEIGNTDVIDYYIRSTYRFLAKKYDLRLYQQYILGFLKNLSHRETRADLKSDFKQLREQLIPLSDKPYEKRAFIYFDIISWLESKISGRAVGEIIGEKARLKIESKKLSKTMADEKQ